VIRQSSTDGNGRAVNHSDLFGTRLPGLGTRPHLARFELIDLSRPTHFTTAEKLRGGRRQLLARTRSTESMVAEVDEGYEIEDQALLPQAVMIFLRLPNLRSSSKIPLKPREPASSRERRPDRLEAFSPTWQKRGRTDKKTLRECENLVPCE
jgi:hypothetical protein